MQSGAAAAVAAPAEGAAPESQDLVPRTFVSEVVAHRDGALATMRQALRRMKEGEALAEQAQALALGAHQGTVFSLNRRDRTETYTRIFESLDEEASLSVYREHLDASVWMSLLERTGMSDLMDRTAKDKLYESLCSDGGVPEVTVENIYATLSMLARDRGLIFRRGLAVAFSSLDRRFKSHDGFKVGARIVLTHLFDGFGHWNWHTRTFDTLADIERAFAVLDGQRHAPRTLRAEIDRDRGRGFSPRQSLTESTYFRVRTWKNGNGHLWFVRDDLVDKVNLELAAYYGEVLPDAAPAPDAPAPGDLKSTSGALSKDLAFYPTPDAVARRVLQDVWLEGKRVLEPSAGTGNLVRHILAAGAARVDAVEVDAGRVAQLRLIRDPRLRATQANFLGMHPTPIYDVAVMNPPFYGTHWMEHVLHAWEFLAPGGTLVSILPVSAELGESDKHQTFRAWAKARSSDWRVFRDLPAESFAESGTRINTVFVVLHK